MQAANPTLVTATATSSTSISITWTDNEAANSFYKIDRQVYGGAWQTIVSTLPADTEAYIATGLNPDTLYKFRVTAVAAAAGEPAEDSDAVESNLEWTMLRTPVISSAFSSATTFLDLTWTNPSTQQDEYDIEWRQYTGGVWGAWTFTTAAGAADLSASVDLGIESTDKYQLRIRASGTTINGALQKDSEWAYSKELYLVPSVEGLYYGYTTASIQRAGDQWTHVLFITGTSPYLKVLAFDHSLLRATQVNVSDVIFGPFIDAYDAAFVTTP